MSYKNRSFQIFSQKTGVICYYEDHSLQEFAIKNPMCLLSQDSQLKNNIFKEKLLSFLFTDEMVEKNGCLNFLINLSRLEIDTVLALVGGFSEDQWR